MQKVRMFEWHNIDVVEDKVNKIIKDLNATNKKALNVSMTTYLIGGQTWFVATVLYEY